MESFDYIFVIYSSSQYFGDCIQLKFTCSGAGGGGALETLLLQDEARPDEGARRHRQYQPLCILRNPHRSLSLSLGFLSPLVLCKLQYASKALKE